MVPAAERRGRAVRAPRPARRPGRSIGRMAATDVKFPQAGTGRTISDERLHRKQQLAAAFRLFGKFGFDEGVAGHITARDPEHLDHFWVNPFGRSFKQMRVSDLILVNHQGDVVEGDGLRQPGGLRDPLAGARRPSRRRRGGALALDLRQVLVRARVASSIPSRRTRARSTATTPCSTTSPGSSSTSRRASASAPRWVRRRPSSCATTGCSPSAVRSRRPRGGSSPWSAPVRRSSSPRRRAPRC